MADQEGDAAGNSNWFKEAMRKGMREMETRRMAKEGEEATEPANNGSVTPMEQEK